MPTPPRTPPTTPRPPRPASFGAPQRGSAGSANLDPHAARGNPQLSLSQLGGRFAWNSPSAAMTCAAPMTDRREVPGQAGLPHIRGLLGYGAA
jgi:hypothetical protein